HNGSDASGRQKSTGAAAAEAREEEEKKSVAPPQSAGSSLYPAALGYTLVHFRRAARQHLPSGKPFYRTSSRMHLRFCVLQV
ncbi:MAG TPA: hypothetical protein VF646_07130, partial [Cytophagales bacterium]